MKKYFVTGIDTDAGKSIASAILVEKLKADYWKPIQAGFPTDSDTVRSLVSADQIIHPEGIILQAPMSPHAAAKLEDIDLRAEQLSVPKTENTLIIEGAGGLLVPINDDEFVINLAKQFDAEVILVSRNYLGSINHTMLSIAYLKQNGFSVAGIIFNDTPNPETERFILQHSQLPCLGRIDPLEEINSSTIQSQLKNINL
ncbi:MAG: dethiobiotin synthase [Reichenbachiella sp.]|uniref:dethiobiotin synthase n=1 Tax=Reichenbachiella sp. TaxID=2184521 RepID=UPI002966DA52|nr:dethiobiotin synthase [Reichenbachiella sp.]MDW3211491.1 dethiobiotin synthase [Reichenbachiella sp.]